jgi:hypothetical protein
MVSARTDGSPAGVMRGAWAAATPLASVSRADIALKRIIGESPDGSGGTLPI